MSNGWVKLWRKSIDSGLIKNHKVWIFWTYCLMKANHKKDFKCVVGFQEVVLQPGQFIFGLKKAAEETCLSMQNIRTGLTFLKKYKNLTIKSTNKFSIVSVINWDIYQQQEKEINKQTNTRVTSSQQASNNIQEQKNKRTKEEDSISLPSGRDTEIEKFCSDFISYIKNTKPTLAPKSKNIQKNSYVTVNQLINLDGYKLEQIIQTMQWAVKDDFWQDNIFSLGSLRRKSSNSLTKFQNIINSMGKSAKPLIHKLNNQNKIAGRSFIERMKEKQHA